MALTEDVRIQARSTGRLVSMKVAADAVIYLGAMVAANAEGFGEPAANDGEQIVVGVAQEHVDNRDRGNGAQTVQVQKGVFGLRNSTTDPVTQAHVGRRVFIEDDGTVTGRSEQDSVVAGVVDEVDENGADGLVYVYFA